MTISNLTEMTAAQKASEKKALKAAAAAAKKAAAAKVKDEPTKVNENKVIYLKDGEKINLHKNKIATNKAVKNDITSFSSAKKFCIANDKDFLSSFKNIDFDKLTPITLLPLRTDREKKSSDKNGISAWLFMSLVKRYYAKN